MEKKVVAVGNGLAIFIDKAYQQLLDISANSLVRITTDGARLVIEPAGERVVRPRVEPWDAAAFMRITNAPTSEERRTEYFAVAAIRALLRLGFRDEHFARLHHYWDDIDFYWGWLCGERPLHVIGQDRQSMRRIEMCWEQMQSGAPLEDAIRYALAELPMDPSGKRSIRWNAARRPTV